MNDFKRLLSMILAFAMIFSMAAVLSGCGADSETVETTGATSSDIVSYSVNVKTRGGLALNGIDVYVYADDTLADLKQYGETDENGQVSFSMPRSDTYAVVLSGVSKGFEVAASYPFSGNSVSITLDSALVTGESLGGANLGLGDVMYDFSVTTPYGETVTLSEILAEKEVAVINFWYNGCSACDLEFPYMQEAYDLYSDSVGIIALDPLFDSSSTKGYQESKGLTLTMASCSNSWTTGFVVNGGNIDAYPTTVVVDRYGVICLIEEGALVNLRYWTSLFEHFTGDDYEQRLLTTADEVLTQVKPTYEMPSSEEIGAVISKGDIEVSFRPESGEDAEYSWPFILGEKNGESCIYASNKGMDSSYAILYADVTLKAGQAVAIDYLASTESGVDVLYVIVDDEPIYNISGVSDPEVWETCYPWVAEKDGTFEVALCYLKDEADQAGDDTIYIKGIRVVEESEIDVATYLPRDAYSTEDGFAYTYAEIVYSEADGYYHVDSADGPLLLANLMYTSEFNEEKTIFEMIYDGDVVVDGHNYYDELVRYCSYASNSVLEGYCPVTQELYDLLTVVDKTMGFDDNFDLEWLKACEYYKAYGTKEQLEDPVKGLAAFSAYEAKLGTNVATNYFYYNRPIHPRGLMAEFVPAKSGVYRITSRNDSQDGVDAWIFDENRGMVYTYWQSERMFNDDLNVSILYYMEAGKPYYIDIAFWDMYETGYIYYDIEYVGSTYEVFSLCSPGYFTYDTDATGEQMYTTIAGGIDVILGEDGYYHEDLGVDENGKQKYGSVIYCDFTGITAVFSNPIANVDTYDADGNLVKDENGNVVQTKGMIDLGGFDFSKTESDLYVLAFLQKYDGDVQATDAYLRELWGEDYDTNAERYQLEDVYEGRYHGAGEDLSDEMRTYLDKIITTGSQEKRGCVPVDQRLAEILQLLMDKYTFEGVEHSWTKVCYYYDYLGPEG
ncbi:MAG: TlpA family protein disulfide reductase [Faecousia sp.]